MIRYIGGGVDKHAHTEPLGIIERHDDFISDRPMPGLTPLGDNQYRLTQRYDQKSPPKPDPVAVILGEVPTETAPVEAAAAPTSNNKSEPQVELVERSAEPAKVHKAASVVTDSASSKRQRFEGCSLTSVMMLLGQWGFTDQQVLAGMTKAGFQVAESSVKAWAKRGRNHDTTYGKPAKLDEVGAEKLLTLTGLSLPGTTAAEPKKPARKTAKK